MPVPLIAYGAAALGAAAAGWAASKKPWEKKQSIDEYWNELDRAISRHFPDKDYWNFFLTLRQLYPEGVGDIASPYTLPRIKDLYSRFGKGQLGLPEGEVAPTPPEEAPPAEWAPTEEERARAWRISAGLEPPVGETEEERALAQKERALAERQWALSEADRLQAEAEDKRRWEAEFGLREQQLAQKPQVGQQGRLAKQQFELQLLSQLVEPSDWIARWMVTKGIQKQKIIDATKRERERASGKSEGAWTSYMKASKNLSEPEKATSQLEEYREAKYGARATRKVLSKAKREDIGLPPASWELSQFVPGLVAGQPITKQGVPVPSGQVWAEASPSTISQLRGYMEYTGQSYADLLNEMARRAPQTPVGAGTSRWTPKYQ